MDIMVTPATRYLKSNSVAYRELPYRYEAHGGTAVSARELGVDEHQVIKTLVFQDPQSRPLLVLMHGDRQVSAKELARQAGLRSLEPCSPERAEKATGYKVGGISPFGQRRVYPVYVESSILDLPEICINGGARGFLVALDPKELERLLPITRVQVAR